MYSRNNQRATNSRCGFSLIEIMVVIVIIGLLAGVLSVSVRGYFAKSKVDIAKIQLGKLVDHIELYQGDNGGQYPTQSQGLAVLVQPTAETGHAILRESDIIDPWNNEFVFLLGTNGQPYEIICLGADGKEGGTGEAQDISHLDL